MRCNKEEIGEVDEPPQNPPTIPPSPPLMSTTEPPQYPPDCLPYRTLSLAAMWEMGIMEKWVDDFARCEELVDEILEKSKFSDHLQGSRGGERIPLGAEAGGEGKKMGNVSILDEGAENESKEDKLGLSWAKLSKRLAS